MNNASNGLPNPLLGNRSQTTPQHPPRSSCCCNCPAGDTPEPTPENVPSFDTIAEMEAAPSTALADGDPVFVRSVAATFLFRDYPPGSAPTDDGITVATPADNTDARYLRVLVPSPQWIAQDTWFMGGDGADDENSGASIDTPLATWAEFVRRTGDVYNLQNPVVDLAVLSPEPSDYYNQRVVDPSGSGRYLRIRNAIAPESTSTVTAFTPPTPNDPTPASLGLIDFDPFAPNPMSSFSQPFQVLVITENGTDYYGTIAYSSPTQAFFTNLYDRDANSIPLAGVGLAASLVPAAVIRVGVLEGDPRGEIGSSSSLFKSIDLVGIRISQGRVTEARLIGCNAVDEAIIDHCVLYASGLYNAYGQFCNVFGGSLGSHDGGVPTDPSTMRHENYFNADTRFSNVKFDEGEHDAESIAVVTHANARIVVSSNTQLFFLGNNSLYGESAPIFLSPGAVLRTSGPNSITKDGVAITWPGGGGSLWDGSIPVVAPTTNNAWNGADNYNGFETLIETTTWARLVRRS